MTNRFRLAQLSFRKPTDPCSLMAHKQLLTGIQSKMTVSAYPLKAIPIPHWLAVRAVPSPEVYRKYLDQVLASGSWFA